MILTESPDSVNPVLQIREGGSRRFDAAVRERSGIVFKPSKPVPILMYQEELG